MTFEELMNFFSETTVGQTSLLMSELVVMIYMIKANISLKNKNEKRFRLLLRKDFKTQDVAKVMIPPEIKIDIKNLYINESKNMIINNKLIYFFFELNKHFQPEDLSLLYYNIGDIEINKSTKFKSLLALLNNNVGTYSTTENRIRINEKEEENALFHELFHMATSYSKDNYDFCGFSQYKDGEDSKENYFSIGNALNEGYTEIMANRYFYIDIEYSGYEYFINMASKLEEIVGKEKMEKCYLHANLKELINELSKYTSIEETMEFIKNMDFLLYHENDQYHKGVIAKNYINTCKRQIVLYLSRTYKEKIKYDFYKFNISKDDAIEKYTNFTLPLFLKDPLGENDNNVNIDDYKKLYDEMCNALGIIPKYGLNNEFEDVNINNEANKL
mgnify:CR=1 FL=1